MPDQDDDVKSIPALNNRFLKNNLCFGTFEMFNNLRNISDFKICRLASADLTKTDNMVFDGIAMKSNFISSINGKSSVGFREISRDSNINIASGNNNTKQLSLMTQKYDNMSVPLNGFCDYKLSLNAMREIELKARIENVLTDPFYGKKPLFPFGMESVNDYVIMNNRIQELLCCEHESNRPTFPIASYFSLQIHSVHIQKDINSNLTLRSSDDEAEKQNGEIKQDKGDAQDVKCCSPDDSFCESSLEFSDFEDVNSVFSDEFENPLAKNEESKETSNSNDDTLTIREPILFECTNYDTGKIEHLIIYPMDQLESLNLRNIKRNKREIAQNMVKKSKSCSEKGLGVMIGIQSKRTAFVKRKEQLIFDKECTKPKEQGIFNNSRDVNKSHSAINGLVHHFVKSPCFFSDTSINQSYLCKNKNRTIFSIKPVDTKLNKSCLEKVENPKKTKNDSPAKPFSLMFSTPQCNGSKKNISVEKITSSDFKKHFHYFAKLGDKLKCSSVITKANSNYWMKRAKIIIDSQGEKVANNCFSETAGKKLVLNISDYTQFLQIFSKIRKRSLSDLVEQLKAVDISEMNHSKKFLLPYIERNFQVSFEHKVKKENHSILSKIPHLRRKTRINFNL